MSGEDVGKLNVYIVGQDEATSLLWRLAGKQGDEWHIARLPVNATEGFKVGRTVESSFKFHFYYY